MTRLHQRETTNTARTHPTLAAPRDAFLVVEHEFEGGPYDGRRKTGLACTDDLHVVSSDDASSTRLVVGAAPTSCLGTYRYLRAYDCLRTLERVHVYRWRESRRDAPDSGTQRADARSITSNSTPNGSRT